MGLFRRQPKLPELEKDETGRMARLPTADLFLLAETSLMTAGERLAETRHDPDNKEWFLYQALAASQTASKVLSEMQVRCQADKESDTYR